jgi:hypothetical protein
LRVRRFGIRVLEISETISHDLSDGRCNAVKRAADDHPDL